MNHELLAQLSRLIVGSPFTKGIGEKASTQEWVKMNAVRRFWVIGNC